MTKRWRWAWLAEDGSEAGHLGMVFLADRVEVTASLARPGPDLVVLDEPDAPASRRGSMEVRASGLWADATEEEQGQRWTIGLEAFALAVDHPDDAVGRRVPIGFDLEWERSGPDVDDRTPAVVHGEVLIESDALDVGAVGWWRRWGPENLLQSFGALGLFLIFFAESGLLVGFFLADGQVPPGVRRGHGDTDARARPGPGRAGRRRAGALSP